MARRVLLAVVLAASATVLGMSPAVAASRVSSGDGNETTNACGPVGAGFARCFAIRLNVPSTWQGRHVPPGHGRATSSPSFSTPEGYSPTDLQDAYNLPSSSGGAGQLVAVVDAYNDPTAESDLAVYRSQFGLPPCTTANGCFRKVNQTGGTSYPVPKVGWGQEISLDLDMVSAVCPHCHILLVEATNARSTNLATAVNTASSLGANAISNSYGTKDSKRLLREDGDYDHPGIAVTAASGDNGYGVNFPASSPFVTAVGGTTLSRASDARGWFETAWSGSGSGCSRFETKPVWQTDRGCTGRTVVDVSAVADPDTGVAVYDTYYKRGSNHGWTVFGGTSVASPLVVSVYALAGNEAALTGASRTYTDASALYDVVAGSTGNCGSYLCNARPGYDGPTGNGTPNGTDAF
jgi:subtilase family serine protease